MVQNLGFEIFGELAEVECAEEPSDIVWENLGLENQNRVKVTIYVAIVLLSLSFLSFFLRYQSTDFGLKYSNMNC